MNPRISIVVPYHDTPQTAFFLSRLMKTIDEQSFKEYEVVLMKEGRMGETYNACIRKSKGEIIKLMGMDDYFYDKDALKKISKAFTPEVYWLATGCVHLTAKGITDYHEPLWNGDLYKGNNTVGGFATISIRNKDVPILDESLDWMIDCDWYWRIFQQHGTPYALKEALVVIGIGPHQTTNQLSMEQKDKEWKITREKYAI